MRLFAQIARRAVPSIALLLALSLVGDAAWADPPSAIGPYKAGSTRATGNLLRGLNFGDAMEAPNEGDWGWRLSEAAFRVAKEGGFDHVRVPMRVSAHADEKPPYLISPGFFGRMDWVIDQALSRDLSVVLDMHHYEEMMFTPKEHADRFVELWRQIATRYKDSPRAVIYELLNEPRHSLTPDVWNAILARTIAAIRAIDPDRLLIVEGVDWASAKEMRYTLRLPAGDKNIIASFHMYAPNYFTHQGAGWMEPWFATRGVVFPGPPGRRLKPVAAALNHPESRAFFKLYNRKHGRKNPSGPAPIIEQMDWAADFARRTGLKVYMGEFGSIINADAQSRANWTRLVRTEAEKRGFGWAYWDFCRNFAAHTTCGADGHWIEGLRGALFDGHSAR